MNAVFNVNLIGLGTDDGVRSVEVPISKMEYEASKDLELVFHYGQNDNQPQNKRSVSVGDTVRYGNSVYRIDNDGFAYIHPFSA